MASRSVIVPSNSLLLRLVARRGFLTGALPLNKEDRSTAESVAHKVGDAVEKAGEAVRDTAKESKEPAESDMRSNVREAAEQVGESTARAGDKIEHSMDEDGADKSKLNKRNLEDKQVLSN